MAGRGLSPDRDSDSNEFVLKLQSTHDNYEVRNTIGAINKNIRDKDTLEQTFGDSDNAFGGTTQLKHRKL